MDNLRERTVSGLGWSGATQMVSQVLLLGTSIVLARLLSKEEFGLVGMILVLTGFATVLSDMGLGAAIIQKRDITDRHLNSVFWLNIAAGGMLTLLFALLAPSIATFYGEPELRALTIAVAINFLLNSLNVVQSALLEKALNFRIKFRVECISLAVSGIVTLTLAFKGAGVWSLVAQSITAATIRVPVMWFLTSWRPALSFDLSAVRELMRFGGTLMGFNTVIYWGTHFDKLVIGRLLGKADLGIFGLADRLMRLPLTNVTTISSTVMFPALSSLQDNPESMKRVYLRATRMIALLTFPMMIGFSILAEPAVQVVYGSKWAETIPIIQLLCFAGMAQSVYHTASWIFMSRGRTDILLRLGIYTTIVRIVGVLIGIHWNLEGIAWAYVIGTYVFICYPTWLAAARLVDLRVTQLVSNLVTPLLCALTMGLLVFASDHWVLASSPFWMRLVCNVTLGAVSYLLLIRHFRLEAFKDVGQVLKDRGADRNRFIRWLLRT